ncbi:MAG: hypothetical protein H6Q13_1641, partial [Bacteroidetes bacterium]|nr:hypothetical protein [Bacteroidota bacterium]
KEVAPLFVNITNIDKVRGFIFELIDKYNTDIKYMYYLFLIIIASLGREKVLCYMKFIQTNKDISRFKELPIESHLFTGSRAGYCNHTLQFLKELMIQIKDLMDVDYIDHLSYLENEKDRLNREQESWAKIEYINNMYD